MFQPKKIFAQKSDYNFELERISWFIGVYDFERKLVDLANDLVTKHKPGVRPCRLPFLD
jgi:hypothetical protein